MRGYYTNASGFGPSLTEYGKPQREFRIPWLDAATTAAYDQQSEFVSATPKQPFVFKYSKQPLTAASNRETHYERIQLYTGGATRKEESRYMDVLGLTKDPDGRWTLKEGTLAPDKEGTLKEREGRRRTMDSLVPEDTYTGAAQHWMRPVSREGSFADDERLREEDSNL